MDQSGLCAEQHRELSRAPEVVIPEEHKASGHFIDTCPPEAQKLYTAIWTELQK